MAIRLYRVPGLPAIAASVINQGAAVSLDSGDVQRQVLPIATVNVDPLGVAEATAAAAGDPILIHDQRGTIVPAVAAGSTGHGADIGVASTNGGLAPVTGASGTLKYRVGQALSAAAAGETFSLYIAPKAISGNTP